MTDLSDVIGMESVAVGWIIHLMMSVMFGAVYGLVLMATSLELSANLGLGAAYGVAIWIMGPLLVMPMMMGDDHRRLAERQSSSLRQPV